MSIEINHPKSSNMSNATTEPNNSDDNVLVFVYHEGTEEVECCNCHTKVDIDNLASLECIMDCKDHKDHDCELKLGYVRLKFTGCGNMCSPCQQAIIYGAQINQMVESSSSDDEGYNDVEYDSMPDSDDDSEVGHWYTDRDGYQSSQYCRGKGNVCDECECVGSREA